MLRIVAFALIGFAFVSCDPVWRISVSGRISSPLDQACAVKALRMEKTVRDAGVSPSGGTYAILVVPESLKSPESEPDVGVHERKNNKGELELEFEMVWVGSRGTPEYRAYVQKALSELLDRTVEQCAK